MFPRPALLVFFMSAILLMSILNCFGKKEKKENLESWLEKKFPGQFEVIDQSRDLQPRHFIEKKMTSVIAAKSDPEVQFTITWYKDQPDLGIMTKEIETSFINSQADVKRARGFSALIKNNGMERTSVAVIDSAVFILPFSEPSPGEREIFTKKILALLDVQPDFNLTGIWIEWMEDSVFGRHFQEIIPDGYWHRGDSWHERHKIMSLHFEYAAGMKYDLVGKDWTFNTASDRSGVFMKEAYQQALSWSERNLKHPFYLEGEQGVRIGLDEMNPMAVQFSFPYFDDKIIADDPEFETKIKGFVTALYLVDEKKSTDIKTIKEL